MNIFLLNPTLTQSDSSWRLASVLPDIGHSLISDKSLKIWKIYQFKLNKKQVVRVSNIENESILQI